MLTKYLRASLLLSSGLTLHTAIAETHQPTAGNQEKASISAQVTRSAFTTGISAREPVDQLARISAGQEVYYFSELTGLRGHVVTHRWEKDGQFQLGLQFPVGADRWRVYSSKSIAPNLPGTWTVSVQGDDGKTLRQDTLIVDPLIQSTETTSAPTKPASRNRPKAQPAAPIWEKLPR